MSSSREGKRSKTDKDDQELSQAETSLPQTRRDPFEGPRGARSSAIADGDALAEESG